MSLDQPGNPLAVDDATFRQIEAAHPQRSTWLAANAGSGKTRVLTDRVARLLLNGTPPQNILCLTYTKAAAGEMQNRLFRRLGEWAMKDDAELSDELRRIGVVSEIGHEALGNARTLFAKAIETPGGLKIQTIHSFCATVLRQFPLEAGVNPAFREVDERESRLLRGEVFDRLAEGPQAGVLAEFSRYCAAEKLDDVLQEILSNSEAFLAAPDEAEILSWYGLSADDTPQTILQAGMSQTLRRTLADLSDVMRQGTPAVKEKGTRLAQIAGSGAFGEAAYEEVRGLLLTKSGTPDKRLLAGIEKVDPAAGEDLIAIGAQLEEISNKLISLEESAKTLVLHRFARVFVRDYQARKDLAGVLDFDDLITLTLRLLSQSAMAEWVLFRLDGGIDHILVDEAQDTSPRQWAIIERLAQEFASGSGARGELLRTIFAVGDRKQSIYSFQGADPAEFDRMRDHFREQLALSEREFRELSLLHSFRSSPLVLSLVDKVFASGISHGTAETTEHIAFRSALPGRLDLWPLIGKAKAEDPPEWHDAADRTVPKDATLLLADRLADEIARMIREDWLPDDSGQLRRVTAGDILVLVRRRSLINEPLMQALKRRGVDVAGADQIDLASDLAVRDVVALLKVLVTPADDLSLAAALRSPIFGLSERDLYHLAQPRPAGKTLLDALESARDTYPEALEVLEDLRSQADFLRPFELIERLLVRHRARQKLTARLGMEIEEALDVLLAQAMAYETSDVPSLTGFLTWHEVEAVKIKRQSEGAGEKLRIMTVHGAKGLEANIVILPDTADYKPPPGREMLLKLNGGHVAFRSAKENRPAALADVYEAIEQRELEESNRLLYVALTRPRQWLITCGAGEDAAKDDKQPCWHRLIASAMQALGAQPAMLAGSEGLRCQSGDWPQGPADGALPPPSEAPDGAELPSWADAPAEPGPPVLKFISPSRLGQGVHSLTSEDDADRDEALRRGTQLHLLLEHLPHYPREDWLPRATGLMSQDEDPPLDEEIRERLDEAIAVMTAPELSWLFAPETEALTEVDVTSDLPQTGQRLLGRIDRLVRRPDGSLLVVDFKSNAEVPATPEAIPEPLQVQMGAYIYALERVFPGRPCGAAILWTRTGQLMELDPGMALAALARAKL